jgi:hypothetical protein
VKDYWQMLAHAEVLYIEKPFITPNASGQRTVMRNGVASPPPVCEHTVCWVDCGERGPRTLRTLKHYI